MLDFKYWITKPVAYDEYYVTKDVLNLMVDKIHQYVFSNSALEFDYDESTFKEKFYKLLYETYYLDEPDDFKPYDSEIYEYFTMKFSDDIIDIYLDCKELVKQYDQASSSKLTWAQIGKAVVGKVTDTLFPPKKGFLKLAEEEQDNSKDWHRI